MEKITIPAVLLDKVSGDELTVELAVREEMKQ